jgi:hypothetical protein
VITLLSRRYASKIMCKLVAVSRSIKTAQKRGLHEGLKSDWSLAHASGCVGVWQRQQAH